MPTTTHGLPYPSLSSANNPPYDLQQLAEKTDALITAAKTEAINDDTHNNQVIIGGRWYTASGVLEEAPNIQWSPVVVGSLYGGAGTVKPPYTPPAGYGFEIIALESSNYVCTVAGATYGVHDGTLSPRLISFGNANPSIHTWGWRLVKIV